MFYCIYYIQLGFETAANEEGSINSLVHFKYSHEIILAEEEEISPQSSELVGFCIFFFQQ